MKHKNVQFKNKAGDALSARLDLPLHGRPAAYAIFAHCFACTKSLQSITNINTALTREGIAALRFDFTGLGRSEGDFSETNFSSNVSDITAAADFLAAEFEAPKILIGHSMGGAAVLQAAADVPSAAAVAVIGAPSDPGHVHTLLGDARNKIEADGEAEIALGGRKFKIRKQFLDDLESNRMKESVRKLRKALLIFHSPLDEIVGVDNAAKIYQAARHPKSFVSLDKADHLLTDPEDSKYVGAVTAAWARKYIGAPAPKETADFHADGGVTARTGKIGYVTEILASGHGMTADEPEDVGGTDLGPSPYGYLLAALGACSSMTLRMYADRKKWPLDAVTVRLTHKKIHAKDCDACESEKGMIDRIEREIDVSGPLDEAQRNRLLEIADRCPVHRTLTGEIVIRSSLKPAS